LAALRSPLTLLLLILCLCWQSLAQAGSAVALADAAEHEHAMLHFHGEAHHHHDGHGAGGIHQDESSASVQHLLDDACTHAPALVASLSTTVASCTGSTLVVTAAASVPSPFVDGFERPPRPRA
jgi:hypothetical protein